MTITEIAATGLLRMMVPPVPDATSRELPDGATRAIALAALAATAGSRGAGIQQPETAVPPAPKNVRSRQARSQGRAPLRSGDYRSQARARKGRGTGEPTDDEADAPSTFSGLL